MALALLIQPPLLPTELRREGQLGKRLNSTALQGRLLTIDGLRGIAAFAVVFYHIHGDLQHEMAGWLYGAVAWICEQGYLGVPIFFVLSGFVITLSVNSRRMSARFAGRFALRRSIRLDPPYWVSMIVAIGLAHLAAALFSDLHKVFPSTAQIVAHLFYLQDILGYGDIVPIYWTLCYEVQFYLFLILLLYTGQRALRRGDTRELLSSNLFVGSAFALAVFSLLEYFRLVDLAHEGLFVRYWFCFSLGMFCYWAVSGWLSPRWFWLHAAAVFVAGIASGMNATAIAASGVASFLYVAGRQGKLQEWLSGSAFQALGRISYSLYLFHSIIGWSTVSLLKRLMGPELSPAEVIVAFVSGVAASLLSGALAYYAIERPSVRWSHLIRVQPWPHKEPKAVAIPLSNAVSPAVQRIDTTPAS